jgi:predicted lysophospholipase L1 biosynthesis ABC-type transport system permease subunit
MFSQKEGVLQRAEIVLDGWPMAAALATAPVLTVVAGWLPLRGLLKRRPMDVLRNE